MLLKRKLALAAMLAAFTLPAWADGFLSSALSAINETTPAGMVSQDSREDGVGGWFRDQGRGFSNIVKQGNTAIVLPVYTEHPAWDYNNRHQENGLTWGGGIARTFVDSRGNERLAYAVAFSDSHYELEPFVGYGWVSRWNVGSTGLHVGAGYLAGSRSELTTAGSRSPLRFRSSMSAPGISAPI